MHRQQPDGVHSQGVRAKRELRERLLERRAGLSTTDLDRAGRGLAAAVLEALPRSGAIAAYASLGTEPPTAPLLAALRGREVLLPVLREDGDLEWARWDGVVVPGARGTQHPPGALLGVDAVRACAAVVVPAVAVDRRGVRLGRGGGSYDRALRRAAGPTLALLHDGELLDAVPEEDHDVRVMAAATPGDGVVPLGGTMLP